MKSKLAFSSITDEMWRKDSVAATVFCHIVVTEKSALVLGWPVAVLRSTRGLFVDRSRRDLPGPVACAHCASRGICRLCG